VEIPALAQGPEQDLVVVNIHAGHGGIDEEEEEAAAEGGEAAGGAEAAPEAE
jgi:hypothetical protein